MERGSREQKKHHTGGDFEISELSQGGGAAWEGQSRGNGQGRGGIGKAG